MFLLFQKLSKLGSTNMETILFLAQGQIFNFSLDKWQSGTFIMTLESKWKMFLQSQRLKNEANFV
jgi:hypothetical protein